MNQSEKNCNNCAHYKAHYIKKGVHFQRVEGLCYNYDINKYKSKNRGAARRDCPYWEQAEDKRAERREGICQTLRRMQEQLAEMLLILKDDDLPE